MHIESVNIGRPNVLIRHGRQYSTAMNRKPVDEPVRLTRTGFEGDRVSDDRAHGGPDRAACCYPGEHYQHWNERLGAALSVPAFGENLTTHGLLETDVCIGDTFRVGGATVQVTSPRQPCAKLALKHDEPRLPKWISETAICGFYLRVLDEGEIGPGDEVRLVERPHADLTVALATRLRIAREPDRALLRRFLDETPLSESWRESLVNRLNEQIDGRQGT